MPTGKLTLETSFDGRRTIVDVIRQEGLARCSRPFHESDGAARVVTSQYGPGFVRGDRFVVDGRVGPGSSLIVTAQSAARAMGKGTASQSRTAWTVEAGASLELIGEPLVGYRDARHESHIEIDLAANARFAFADIVVTSGSFDRISSRLCVRRAGRSIAIDAWQLRPSARAQAVASAFTIDLTSSATETDADLEFAQAYVDKFLRDRAWLADFPDAYRVGLDRLACAGGIALRAIGPQATILRDLAHGAVAAIAESSASRAGRAPLGQRGNDRRAGLSEARREHVRHG